MLSIWRRTEKKTFRISLRSMIVQIHSEMLKPFYVVQNNQELISYRQRTTHFALTTMYVKRIKPTQKATEAH